MPEWYNNNNKSIKSGNNPASHSNEEFYTKNKNIKKKIMKVKIVYNMPNQTLEDKINYDIYKNSKNEGLEFEIYNTETIGNLLKKCCNRKKIKDTNLYLMKKDLKKLKNNLTLSQAGIVNNETIFLFEANTDNNDDKNDEINFNINYRNEIFSFTGWKKDSFLDCIQSFVEEKKGNNFLFIHNNNIIDKNKTLDELNIKNGDEVKVGEFK